MLERLVDAVWWGCCGIAALLIVGGAVGGCIALVHSPDMRWGQLFTAEAAILALAVIILGFGRIVRYIVIDR
jgi:hypothetical protein